MLKTQTMMIILLFMGLLLAGCGDDTTDPPDDGTEWTFYTDENSGLPVWTVRCIAIDSQGRKWLGTEGGGVAVFDDTTDEWTVYTEPGGFINDIYIDGDGIVWVGGEYSGLYRFDGDEWQSISGLPDNEVHSIIMDNDANLWVGTHQGLAKFDGNAWAVYDTLNSDIPSNIVPSLAFDNDGSLWVGTAKMGNVGRGASDTLTNNDDESIATFVGGGLAKFDGENWIVYDKDNSSLPGNIVYSIEIDHLNQKWIGTNKGLAVLGDQNWTIYTSQNSDLPYNGIYAIDIDLDNVKWICAYVKGFAKFDDTTWDVYDPNDYGSNSGLLRDLAYDDETGIVWVGTSGGGLIKFEEN